MSENSRTYTVGGSNITIAGGPTLVFINVDSDVGINILRCWAAQDSTETNEQQRVNLVTQVTAFPTLTSVEPVAHLFGETSRIVGGTAGAAGTCGIDATVEGAGAKTIVVPDAFNNLLGALWVPTPKEIISIRAGEASGFGLVLDTTPSVLTGWSFGVTYEEI